MEMRFTSENFEAEVLKSEVPVLVDFYADWCGPCKRMAPIVEQLAAEYEGRLKVGKMDVAVKYGIMSIPTLIIFKNGEIFRREAGVQTKKSIEMAIGQVL